MDSKVAKHGQGGMYSKFRVNGAIFEPDSFGIGRAKMALLSTKLGRSHASRPLIEKIRYRVE